MRPALLLCLLSGLALAQPEPLRKRLPALTVLPVVSNGLPAIGANECPTGVSLLGSRGEAVTFTAAGAGRHCTRTDGGLVSLAANEPAVSGGAVKVRASVQNLATYSETFNSWTAYRANLSDAGVPVLPVVTAGAAVCDPAPDGTSGTADLIDFSALEDLGATPTGWATVYVAFTSAGAAYSDSLWVRAADVADGGSLPMSWNQTTASNPDNVACAAGASYVRCQLNSTLAAGSHYVFLGPDTRAGYSPAHAATFPALSVCVWGAQAALGSTAVDYCGPTTTGAVTCAAEVFSGANALAAAPANPTQWCITGTIGDGKIGTADVGGIGAGGANSAYLGHGFFGVFDSTNTQKYIAITGTSAGTYSGCTVDGTLAVYRDGVSVGGAVAGAGTGIITTQPATVYIGGTSTGGYPVGAWSNFRLSRGVSPP